MSDKCFLDQEKGSGRAERKESVCVTAEAGRTTDCS